MMVLSRLTFICTVGLYKGTIPCPLPIVGPLSSPRFTGDMLNSAPLLDISKYVLFISLSDALFWFRSKSSSPYSYDFWYLPPPSWKLPLSLSMKVGLSSSRWPIFGIMTKGVWRTLWSWKCWIAFKCGEGDAMWSVELSPWPIAEFLCGLGLSSCSSSLFFS